MVDLKVNGDPIKMDYFVEGFLDHTVRGMLAALEGTSELRTLELKVEGEDVTIILNAENIPLNEFAATIVRKTLTGLISSLKGVEEILRFVITITC
jgi:hypothetical protein